MRIGMVAYACNQGLGYLAKSFYDAEVIDEVLWIRHRHPDRPSHPEWYGDKALEVNPRGIKGTKVDEVLKRLDVMLFFETPFDWKFPDYCRKHNVKTVMMPMYEWFPKDKMKTFDGYLCPSELDINYFHNYPYKFFQPPVNPSTWKLRIKAKRFLHNAGNIGHREHKGTRELLQAMEFVKSPIKLTVRCQDTKAFCRMLKDIPSAKEDPRLTFCMGEIPYEELFDENHDVYIAPEKFNGLSLPLQEAYAAGMLVMASDRYPTQCWLPFCPLIPVHSFHTVSIGSSYLEFQEAEIRPQDIAVSIDKIYDQDIIEYSDMGALWGYDNSWEQRKEEFLKKMKTLCFGGSL